MVVRPRLAHTYDSRISPKIQAAASQAAAAIHPKVLKENVLLVQTGATLQRFGFSAPRRV